MTENTSVVRIAGVVLGSWILAAGAILVDCAPSLAGSPSDYDLIAADKSRAQQAAKGEGKKPTDAPCADPIPCAVNNPPMSGDVASDGSACTSGYSCKIPGAGCGPGARTDGACTTIPLGNGKCACGCMY